MKIIWEYVLNHSLNLEEQRYLYYQNDFNNYKNNLYEKDKNVRFVGFYNNDSICFCCK